MMEQQQLLDPQFLRRLERLSLVNKRMIRGTHSGQRRSRHLGSSLEFADYRSYAPGDDLRQLDWHAFARLGKLFLKTFLDEQEWHVSLYIDCSKSMGYGEPSKFFRAVQLAAALGFLSLTNFDRVSVYAFDQQLVARLPNLFGKGKSQHLLQFLQGLQLGQAGDLNRALHSGRAVQGKPGIAIIFSDFLFENGYEEGLRFLQAAVEDVTLIHLLAAEERVPALQGDVRLVDSETEEGREVSITPPLLEAYVRSVRQYQESLSSFAFSRGMGYIDVQPEQRVEQIIFRLFQQAGLLR